MQNLYVDFAAIFFIGRACLKVIIIHDILKPLMSFFFSLSLSLSACSIWYYDPLTNYSWLSRIRFSLDIDHESILSPCICCFPVINRISHKGSDVIDINESFTVNEVTCQ